MIRRMVASVSAFAMMPLAFMGVGTMETGNTGLGVLLVAMALVSGMLAWRLGSDEDFVLEAEPEEFSEADLEHIKAGAQ